MTPLPKRLPSQHPFYKSGKKLHLRRPSLVHQAV